MVIHHIRNPGQIEIRQWMEEEILKATLLVSTMKCASMAGKTGSKLISMCIISVKVKHWDGKDMITTYAMLDNCSQGSFVHDNMVKELGVQGMKTTLKLKTLHGEKTESIMLLEAIKMTGMSGDGSLLLLSKLYTRR